MQKLTDFNDLHCAAGLDAIRVQFNEILVNKNISENESSPAPSIEESGFSVDSIIQRFALVHGETKFWDLEEKRFIKKTAFIDLVTRPIFNDWLKHPKRRVIKLDECKRLLSNKGTGEQMEMLERYFYLYPTKSAWDNERKEEIPIDVLKMAYPSEFDWWNKNPSRRIFNYENIVFDPKQRSDPNTHINRFSGLPLTPAKNQKGCENILKLVWNLCNDDPAVFEFLCKWLAYPLQKVGSKLDTAILMHSDVQGTGKSMLFSDLMPQIYGIYGSVLGQHQLESQYTEWRSQLLFASFEEIFSRSQKYSHMGTVKHMITGKTQRIEKKFVNGWEEANHMNAAFLSNELQPFPVEKTDRRMFVIWPEKTMSTELQFAAGGEIEEENQEGAKAFYRFLLNYPLDDFNSHTKPPMTEAKQRLIDYSLPPWDVFFIEWKSGDLNIPFQTCSANSLYIAYSKFCRRRNEHLVSQTKFSTIMSTKIKKERIRYDKGSNVVQAMCFILDEEEKQKDRKERSQLIESFDKSLENMEGHNDGYDARN